MAGLTSFLPIPEGTVGVVVAHPDDESFGLGALIAGLTAEHREIRVLCFTHGEASTLGAHPELGRIRRDELFAAAAVLGVAEVTLHDLPDGGLDALPEHELDARIDEWLTEDTAALLVLEPDGGTGHPDHRASSRAAERAADRHRLTVLEWGISPRTAELLHRQLGSQLTALPDGPGVFDVPIERTRQLAAIRCHASQLDENPLVLERLALQGDRERVHIRAPRPMTPA